jgi:hypothetical protein
VNGGFPRVLEFIYPQEGNCLQEERWNSHTPYLTSVDIIEVLTGIDFLVGLPDDIEEAIERVIQIRLWD